MLNIGLWALLTSNQCTLANYFSCTFFLTLLFLLFTSYNTSLFNNKKLFNLFLLLYIFLAAISLSQLESYYCGNFYPESTSIVTSSFSIYIFDLYIKPLEFIYDHVTSVFNLIVLLIGIGSNLYSQTYLNTDKNKHYFLSLLNFFIFSMLGLVNTNSLIIALLCWEGLGISSFFLINYFRNRPFSLKSSFKAFSFNRLSDIFFFLFTVMYYFNNGNLDILQNSLITPKLNDNFCFLFLALTASIKSAQHIFFFWLPDSMEAPIPASALIHSATLVAAGIYLLFRFKNYFQNNLLINYYFILSGILSAVIFSFVSLLQTDIKRLLAYSTIANCGFIYFLIGLGCENLGLFYFAIHGLFKSILFLTVGNLILTNHHNQDFQYWTVTNTTVVLNGLLILGFMCLSTLNLTFTFEIKHFISNSFHNSNTNITWCLNFLFLQYTLHSVLYGLKLPLFLTTKSYSSKSLLGNKIRSTNYILLGYVTYILISVLLYYILLGNNVWSQFTQSQLNLYKVIPFCLIIGLVHRRFTYLITFLIPVIFIIGF